MSGAALTLELPPSTRFRLTLTQETQRMTGSYVYRSVRLHRLSREREGADPAPSINSMSTHPLARLPSAHCPVPTRTTSAGGSSPLNTRTSQRCVRGRISSTSLQTLTQRHLIADIAALVLSGRTQMDPLTSMLSLGGSLVAQPSYQGLLLDSLKNDFGVVFGKGVVHVGDAAADGALALAKLHSIN